ncbi:hypothetical protein PR048_021994 [Dryococelus australis]|uniref:Uncharacterized protein n=1 Tax=Dryococelus australis TaxID=614101 RepID=A0ABQ9GZS8_9NEOP|nr:hypothetical protein PR048_021994 [Dryococelus australis]
MARPTMRGGSGMLSSWAAGLSGGMCWRMHDDSSCLYSANALPQRAHTCGFVLECVCTCARKLDLSANALLHTGHLKGFSPAAGNLVGVSGVSNRWNKRLLCISASYRLRGPWWFSGQTTRFPHRRSGFDSRPGRSRILARENRWSGGFSGTYSVSPVLAFRSCSILTSLQSHDGNTARLARRSDEALDVRVSVARIAFSLVDLGRGGSIPLLRAAQICPRLVFESCHSGWQCEAGFTTARRVRPSYGPTCVRADVSLQEPGPGEALATVGALAALVVRPHVHGEGRHRHIHLPAVRAAARLLVAGRAVCLAVASQVARRRVALAAVGARVRLRLLRLRRRRRRRRRRQEQVARGRRQAHLRQLRQVVELIGAGRRLQDRRAASFRRANSPLRAHVCQHTVPHLTHAAYVSQHGRPVTWAAAASIFKHEGRARWFRASCHRAPATSGGVATPRCSPRRTEIEREERERERERVRESAFLGPCHPEYLSTYPLRHPLRPQRRKSRSERARPPGGCDSDLIAWLMSPRLFQASSGGSVPSGNIPTTVRSHSEGATAIGASEKAEVTVNGLYRTLEATLLSGSEPHSWYAHGPLFLWSCLESSVLSGRTSKFSAARRISSGRSPRPD